MATVGVKGII